MLTNWTKRYPFSLLTTIVIVVLSLMPIGRVELAEDVPLADKWTHMVMYATLVIVIWWEYRRQHQQTAWTRCLAWAFIAPIALGGVMELMQAYCTNYRSGDWMDFVANSIGVGIGSLIGIAILPHFIEKK
ncbi:MAG: VanZ family protein [Bacteroidaceae bacterium]|nr:VanZ family protein [Bacteroidaceae bacterium]